MADAASPQQVALQKQLSALDVALASGISEVTYDGGKSVRFRSRADMLAARSDLLKQLGLPLPTRRTVAAYNGGFR